MESWQERVFQEKYELDEKIEKLKRLLLTTGPDVFNNRDRSLLNLQLDIMNHYSHVLGERIARFE